jgi:hypothetical protein
MDENFFETLQHGSVTTPKRIPLESRQEKRIPSSLAVRRRVTVGEPRIRRQRLALYFWKHHVTTESTS